VRLRNSARLFVLFEFLHSWVLHTALRNPSLLFPLDPPKPTGNSEIVTENEDTKSSRSIGRRRLAVEALILFVFAWVGVLAASLLRPRPMDSFADAGILRFVKSTLLTGLEIFVFGYVLSRFFKQFKTGCAFVIILFFAYLIWAGRIP
jgi:hypothetical protein